MTSFMAKLRIVTLGTVHDLLDKQIDMNSPSALRQYTRDIEDALDKMKNDAAVQAGGVRTLEREKGDLESRITSMKAGIQVILQGTGATREAQARNQASIVLTLQTQLTRTTADLESQRTNSASIDAAVAKLEAKHSDIVAHVRNLENLDRQTKSKEQSARTLNAAGKILNAGADFSIDDIESRMKSRGDVADEQFNRAMGSIDMQEDPQKSADIDNLISELKPKEASVA